MSTIFVILMLAAMAAVLGSLGIGLIAMARGGGEAGARLSNKAMRWRVILQGAALLFFLLAMLTSGRS